MTRWRDGVDISEMRIYRKWKRRKERRIRIYTHTHARKKKKIYISSSCNSCFSTVGDIIKEAVARLSHHIYRPQSSSSLIFINFIFLLFVLLLFYLYLYTVMMRKGKLRIDARWHWLKNSPTTSRITKWESSTSSNTWARIDERRW